MEHNKKPFNSGLENNTSLETSDESNKNKSEPSIESSHTNTSEISVAGETELIDVDDIELSDEESWLYKSPKKVSLKNNVLTTCDWLSKNLEDLNNLELQQTKDALVKKLEQLQLDALPGCSTISDVKKTINNVNCVKTVLVAEDVHKLAQLQEESLQQSSLKLLIQSGRTNSRDRIDSQVYHGRLSKPSSTEDFNACNGRFHDIISSQTVKNHMKVGSTLHEKQDIYHGSLPNIYGGYNSLRSKKCNQPIDPSKKFCPLPLNPSHSKQSINASEAYPLKQQFQVKTPPGDYPESRTLPSSYRMRSRSNPRGADLSPSPRRESIPLSPGFKRRESAPSSPQKNLSPFLPSRMYQRNSVSSAMVQSSNSMNHPKNMEGIPPKRSPLSTMLNQSPRSSSSPASPRREATRGIKSPSKIPSTISRSGIPMPANYMSKGNKDDNWSNGCF